MPQLLREGGRAFANVLVKLRVKPTGTTVRWAPDGALVHMARGGAIFWDTFDSYPCFWGGLYPSYM